LLTWSRVEAIFASSGGERNATAATNEPTRILVVTAAMALNVVKHSS
jgi:hypothetical protein